MSNQWVPQSKRLGHMPSTCRISPISAVADELSGLGEVVSEATLVGEGQLDAGILAHLVDRTRLIPRHGHGFLRLNRPHTGLGAQADWRETDAWTRAQSDESGFDAASISPASG